MKGQTESETETESETQTQTESQTESQSRTQFRTVESWCMMMIAIPGICHAHDIIYVTRITNTIHKHVITV